MNPRKVDRFSGDQLLDQLNFLLWGWIMSSDVDPPSRVGSCVKELVARVCQGLWLAASACLD